MARIVKRRCEIAVEFHHVDMMQVVHNSNYLRWFEIGRLAIMEDIFPISWAIENKIATPVVTNHCEYLWPAVYGDTLVLTTTHKIRDHWEGRFSFDHTISCKRTKKELCRGYSVVTVVDMGSASLVKEIPKEAWDRYQALA